MNTTMLCFLHPLEESSVRARKPITTKSVVISESREVRLAGRYKPAFCVIGLLFSVNAEKNFNLEGTSAVLSYGTRNGPRAPSTGVLLVLPPPSLRR
jgi:hypothetical protein